MCAAYPARDRPWVAELGMLIGLAAAHPSLVARLRSRAVDGWESGESDEEDDGDELFTAELAQLLSESDTDSDDDAVPRRRRRRNKKRGHGGGKMRGKKRGKEGS